MYKYKHTYTYIYIYIYTYMCIYIYIYIYMDEGTLSSISAPQLLGPLASPWPPLGYPLLASQEDSIVI